MRYYRDTENGEVVSEDQIRREWENDHCEHETFEEYIKCCLSKNGFLERMVEA